MSNGMTEANAREIIGHVASLFPDGPLHESPAGRTSHRPPKSAGCQRASAVDREEHSSRNETGKCAEEKVADKQAAAVEARKQANAALHAQLKALTEQANEGAPGSLDALRDFLRKHPEVEQHVGDLARHAETAWVHLLADGNTLIHEAVQRRLTALKAELAGEHPTPLERMLVEHVGIAFLANQHATIAEASSSGGTIQQAALRLRRAESAQKRYLAAVKTLSVLRARVPAGLAPLKGLKLHNPQDSLGNNEQRRA